MNDIKFRYNFINAVVLATSAVLFMYGYKNIGAAFSKSNMIQLLIVLLTVVIVHIIKAGRLYLALYGSDISFKLYLKVYCKVTPVSMLIPYKLGEVFKIYCYGMILKNMTKGMVIVLLDRFMDTIALVTMILLVLIVSGSGYITPLIYMLIIFLIFILSVYVVFPGVCTFWKHYMLHAKATERKLNILKMLMMLQRVYEEIQDVSKGRGIILYIMSLAAWAVEIGNIVFQVEMFQNTDISKAVTDYLSSAMGSNSSDELILKLFIFVSVLIMLATYFAVKLVELSMGKKAQDENNSGIR